MTSAAISSAVCAGAPWRDRSSISVQRILMVLPPTRLHVFSASAFSASVTYTLKA